MALRVLTWNLMHGRSVPPAGRDLIAEFADALAAWEWDLALLQEVPPWWPAELAERLPGPVAQRTVLTSRNALLPVRQWIAERWPDLIKSNGGGANAILARGSLRIEEHRTRRLRTWPERRQLQAVRLGGTRPDADGGADRDAELGADGGADLGTGTGPVWAGNLHATVHNDRAARREAFVAGQQMLRWAGQAPIVLGGDFNVRGLELLGYELAAVYDVDHLFVRGLAVSGEPEVLDRGRLSDHAPVAVTLQPR